MKRLIFIKALVFLILTSQVNSQNSILSVTGHVFDIETSLPVYNQNVVLNVTGNGMTNTYEFYSNEEGFWGSDSLLAYNQGTVQAITYDCNGEIQEFLENYFPDSTTFVFDFYICQDSVPGGDCINWFTYEQTSLNTFSFHGESLPSPADYYKWDFGDGQSGFGQEISHSFDPGMGSQFLVQLSTFLYDPATGDSCIAFSEQWVYLDTIPNCEADFYFITEMLPPLTVQFFDISIGIITDRFWDFGDGSSSIEINPIHIFSGPGNYNVCLTITSDSLGIFCTDTYCMEINLQVEIHAEFTFALDTLSGMTRNYYFFDASTGEPGSWQWNFGDGNYSSTQNPIHQFAESGTYNVCLQITKSFPNGGYQTDNYCQEIMAPSYYDIGGLTFIGNTPLNNPVSTGDTGIACLYRKYENLIIPVDTNYFYELGYYWFTDVREGNHIIKVGLTENSEHFQEFAPAYFPDQLYWENAQTLPVSDSNSYSANVYLPEIPGATAGPGAIYGYIVDLPNPSLPDYVAGQPVFLYSSSDELLIFTLSDMMGNFSFGNLAYGTYKLYAEVTGFYTEPVTVTIDQNNPVYMNALLEISETNTIGIRENIYSGFQTGPVYPNPLTDHLSLDVTTDRDRMLGAIIYNLHGQKMYEDEFMIYSGNTSLTISTDYLEPGLYFITLKPDGEHEQNSYKFLKK
jgi:PKD repeat protein